MTTLAHDAALDAPCESDVRAALERILASDSFRGSPQLGTFLRFVVDAVLCGRGPRLKGYTIGVEALGRDPRFNPQVDPIVRVEATRLRRALARYYTGAGADDPVVIELPRGGYAPCFRRGTATPAAVVRLPAQALAGARRNPPARSLLAIGALAVAAVSVAFLLPLPRSGGQAVEQSAAANLATPTIARRLPPGNGMPTIAVDPLRVVGTPAPGTIAAGTLIEKVRDAFARFDTINVASGAPADAGPAQSAPPHAEYRLAGSLDYGETQTTVRFQLIDAAEGTIAWSRSFAFPAGAGDQSAGQAQTAGQAEDEIVGALAHALLQSYGVIRSRDRAKQLASPAGDPRYRCVLAAADSFRSVDPAAHDRARTCLESLTAADPGFALGFEFLAIMYLREDALDRRPRAGEAPALDRALRAARHAIELAPASARAYQMLFVVQYARHDVEAAFAAGDKAMALNRYDMLTAAEYGGRLVMTGEVERGMAVLRRAGEAGGVHPSWHHFYRFLGSYLLGDAKEAAFQAEQITTDDYPLGLVAQAVVASDAGNHIQAQRAIDRLIELQPAWRNDARRLLEKTIYRRDIVDRLLRGLARAGLSGAS